MFKILKKEYLANNIWLMDIEAPRVAKHCQRVSLSLSRPMKKESVVRLRYVIMTASREVLRLYFRQLEHLLRRWQSMR